MINRNSHKIKQRKKKLKENEIRPVIEKQKNSWSYFLLIATAVSIVYLLSVEGTSEITNETIIRIIICIAVLILLVIWFLPKYYVRSLLTKTGKDFDCEKEKLKLEDDTRKTFAQIVGGIVFLGGLIFTYNTFHLQQNTYQLQQEGQLTERFTKAIEQLGNDNLEVRLGGLYALERISKDSQKDYWTMMEVLSAYVRERSVQTVTAINNKKSKAINKPERIPKVLTDVESAMLIIGRRTQFDTERERVNLNSAKLTRAELPNTNFTNADFRSADFRLTDLRKTILWGADLRGSVLAGASLNEADMREVDIESAYLNLADFSGANLSETKNLTFEQIKECIIDESTKLPEFLQSRITELLELSKKNIELKEQVIEEQNKIDSESNNRTN